MSKHRPGDVLAGRYRLADLLSESEHGRFWLAHDTVLGRAVAVHVIDADDPRAPELMRAARISASLADQRLLRVLDAETREGISYVVNEWARGTSLDVLLVRSGPMAPRQAAWVTSEVAATLRKAHDLGHAHGRLIPENVLIDEAGGVRIIGFAVETALYGLPAGAAADDDAHLAAILTACLTGTWPGETPSSVPRTPLSGGHPMRPRQVRAGVPKALDDLCEAALNPASRGRHAGPTLDAGYVHDRLLDYLGDPSDVAGRPVEPLGHTDSSTVTISTALTMPSAAAPDAPATPTDHTDVPTEASLPSFEDDSSWHLPRTTPVAPPPALEPPAPKPLFADEPRVPRAGAAEQTERTEHAAQDDAPWFPTPEAEAGWDGDPVSPRRRRWLPLAVGLVILVLVVAAVLLARDISGGGGSAGPSPSPSAAPPAAPIKGVIATDFDPLGNPPSENPELAKYAVDGKESTSWHTVSYNDQLGTEPPALKSGVGLLLDLRHSYTLDTATISVDGGETGVSVYVSDTEPTGIDGLKRVARATVSGSDQKLDVNEAVGRYVVVWLTTLPPAGSRYRGEIAEVALTGSRH